MSAVRRALARVPWALIPEWLVLAAVLAIAAVASYIHLRAVWIAKGAPIPDFGPLLVDGLFAAAWLRMRRRRQERVAVGWLAWAALALALVATIAGNVVAAWIAGHRDPLALVVAAWPAVAFALVWELVTGHGGGPTRTAPSFWRRLAQHWRILPQPAETWENKRDRLLAAGVGRPTLVAELGITESAARQLLDSYRQRNGAAV